MRNNIFSFVIIGLIAFTFFSCEQQKDETDMNDDPVVNSNDPSKVNEHHEFWVFDRDYTYQDRDSFKSDVEKAEEKLDQKIDELQEKADKASGEAKEEYEEQIKNLKDKKEELDDKMKDFGDVTEDTWNDFKSGVTSVWNDIEDSWNDMMKNDNDY